MILADKGIFSWENLRKLPKIKKNKLFLKKHLHLYEEYNIIHFVVNDITSFRRLIKNFENTKEERWKIL